MSCDDYPLMRAFHLSDQLREALPVSLDIEDGLWTVLRIADPDALNDTSGPPGHQEREKPGEAEERWPWN